MNPLLPWMARFVSSQTLRDFRRGYHTSKRKLLAKSPTVQVFISPDDPYSLLLMQALPSLQQRFNVNWKIYTVIERASDMFPRPQLWRQNALVDSQRLAKLYDLNAPQILPNKEQSEALAQHWARWQTHPDFLTKALDSGMNLWSDQSVDFEQTLNTEHHRISEKIISKNEKLRKRLGHYFSAMMHFEGEWYWGIDRLDHLEKRFIEQGLCKGEQSVKFDRQYQSFCQYDPLPTEGKTLELYFSLRSPYSYLALIKAKQFCDHNHLKLNLKVVLPMVMRGLPIPEKKKMYIFLDAKREGDKQGIPYGFLTDPLGLGVLNCYALYDLAQQKGKGVDLMIEFAKGINSEALNAEKESDLKIMVERAGLVWAELRPALYRPSHQQEQWRAWANQHEQELYNHGLWGVPSMILDDVKIWGQDRFWVLEEYLQQQPPVELKHDLQDIHQ